jgi:hypothetical protein
MPYPLQMKSPARCSIFGLHPVFCNLLFISFITPWTKCVLIVPRLISSLISWTTWLFHSRPSTNFILCSTWILCSFCLCPAVNFKWRTSYYPEPLTGNFSLYGSFCFQGRKDAGCTISCYFYLLSIALGEEFLQEVFADNCAPASVFLVDMNICYSLLVSPMLSLHRRPWYRLISSDGRKSSSESTPELKESTTIAWRFCFLHTGNFFIDFWKLKHISLWNLKPRLAAHPLASFNSIYRFKRQKESLV